MNPGDLIEASDSPVGLKLNKGSEIIFARQFKNQKDSITATPYTLRQLPFTAKKAIERLEPGDFVAMQGQMSLVLSVGKELAQGDFNAGASTKAFLSGEFKIHLFRMNNNKIRVKLIALNGKGVSEGTGVDFSGNLELLGVNVIDRRIEKWINLTPFDAEKVLSKNNVVMFDYVFNLNNSQAAQAYDALLMDKMQFRDVKIANPKATTKDITKELITDLTDIEEISLEDANLAPQDRRIDRVFKGTTEGHNNNTKVKFGLSLWKFEAGKVYGENKVLSYDKQDNEQYFLLDTLSRFKKTKILFGLFGEETLVSSNLLFTADKNWKAGRFVTLTSSAEMKMKDVSERDLSEIQKMVRDTIGNTQYSKIDWSSWENSPGKKVNGYFKQEVFFNPGAVKALPLLSEDELAVRFKEYIKSKGRPRSLPLMGGNTPKDYVMNWVGAFTGDIGRAAKRLSIVVNTQKTIQERFEAFEDLQKMPIWKERGLGFLMSFVSENQRESMLRYEMTLSAKDMATIRFSFGQFSEEKLYRSLVYIQNVINNRSFDLRLYTDKNGEFTATKAESLQP